MGNFLGSDFHDYSVAFADGPKKKGARFNTSGKSRPYSTGTGGGEPLPRKGKAVPLPRSDDFTFVERAQRVVVHGEPIDGPAARKKAERIISHE